MVDVYNAEEAFLTGTFGAQVPVETIDGRVIGYGKAGPLTLKIRTLYFELIEKVSP